jgi:hypothetical protein
LAVATNTRWVPFGHKASAPHSADGRPAQVVDVTLTRWFSGSGTGRRISNELGCARGSTPGRGDSLDSKNYSCPLSRKPAQKRFLPQKGGAVLWKAFLAKKFQVREKILIV